MTTLISWNVNGLRAAVRNGFLAWFEAAQPDILCIQECRAMPDELEPSILNPKGYRTFWQPSQRKGYSGVAVFTKQEPLSVSAAGIEAFDNEGRVQILEYKTFTLINAYFPNSQPERARIGYKLAFCGAILELCEKLRHAGRNVIVSGDYNIAHTEIDLARPKDNENTPGYFPEERAAMTTFLDAGYVDAFRHFTKEPGHYTWWSYRFHAREKNIGWRLDYHCANLEFMDRVKACTILSGVTGSDHCPVALTLK